VAISPRAVFARRPDPIGYRWCREGWPARDQNRGAFAQLQRDEEKEIAGYLSPVQRARLDLLRERFAGMRSRRGPGGRRGRGGWGSRESWHRARPQ